MAHGAPDYYDRSLIQGKYGNDFIPVKVDADGQMFISMTGQAIQVDNLPIDYLTEGGNVAIPAGTGVTNLPTDYLTEGGNVAIPAGTDVNDMPPVQGEDAGTPHVIAVDSTGVMLARMKGAYGAFLRDIAVDDSGVMLSQMKGMYGGNPVNMALDSDGNMTAKMKGSYEGTSKDLAVDIIGRILSTIVGKYEVTPSYTMIENCDLSTNWTCIDNCSHDIDTVDKIEGAASIKITWDSSGTSFEIQAVNLRNYSSERYLSLAIETNLDCTRHVIYLCSKYVTDIQVENCDNSTDWAVIDNCSLATEGTVKTEGSASLKITWDGADNELSFKSDNNRDYTGSDYITFDAKVSGLCDHFVLTLASKWVESAQRQNCDETTHWTTLTNCSIAADTNIKHEGTAAIKVTWNSNGSDTRVLNDTLQDWSSKRYLSIWLKRTVASGAYRIVMNTDASNWQYWNITPTAEDWTQYTIDLNAGIVGAGTWNKASARVDVRAYNITGAYIMYFDDICLVNTPTPSVDPIDYKYWNINCDQTDWKEYQITLSSPAGSGGTLDISACNMKFECVTLPANFLCYLDDIRKKTGSGEVGDMIDYKYWYINFSQQEWKEYILDLNSADGSSGGLNESSCKLHYKAEGVAGAFITHLDRIRLTNSASVGGAIYKNLACDENGVLELNIKAQDLAVIKNRSFEGKTQTHAFDEDLIDNATYLHNITGIPGMVKGGFIHTDFMAPISHEDARTHHFRVYLDGEIQFDQTAQWMYDNGITSDGKAPIYLTNYDAANTIYEYGISKDQSFDSSFAIMFRTGNSGYHTDCISLLTYLDKT